MQRVQGFYTNSCHCNLFDFISLVVKNFLVYWVEPVPYYLGGTSKKHPFLSKDTHWLKIQNYLGSGIWVDLGRYQGVDKNWEYVSGELIRQPEKQCVPLE